MYSSTLCIQHLQFVRMFTTVFMYTYVQSLLLVKPVSMQQKIIYIWENFSFDNKHSFDFVQSE